ADDDTIGEVLTAQSWAYHTGNPQGKYYANPALWIYNISSTLSNVRISHAREGIRVEGTSAISSSISHAQLVNCVRGVVLTGDAGSSGAGGSGISVVLNNNLMANVQYPISIYSAAGGTIYNCTFDQSAQAIAFTGTYANFSVVNSVFANVSSLAPYLHYQ